MQSIVKPSKRIATASTASAYLASDLVTVYSNHKMLGIRLVSRTRKYSEIGLSNHEKGNEKSIYSAITTEIYIGPFKSQYRHNRPVHLAIQAVYKLSSHDTRRKQRNEISPYHAAILGNIGVSTSCVKKNQIMPKVLPATPP